jgi:hypothetical protein
VDTEDPLDKATKHESAAVYYRWFCVFDLRRKASLHWYLSTRIPMAHVFSITNFL